MRFYLLLISFSIFSTTYADISIKSEIKEVTVFTNGGRIKSDANAILNKGTYNLLFENLSQYIEENSIQLKGNSEFTILSISVKKDFLNEGFKDATLKKLEDSLVVLKAKVSQQQSTLNALSTELNMINANQKIGGANSTVNVVDIEKMANFIRIRIEEITNKQYEISNQKNKWQKKADDIQSQINTYNGENSKNKAYIIVSINSNTINKTDFELTYNVGNVGWSPFYDIISESISMPIKIIAKAKVWQNTGENWNNVKLFISTGNPTQSNQIPTLFPYYLNVQPENVSYQAPRKLKAEYGSAAAPMSISAYDKQDAFEEKASSKGGSLSNNSSRYTQNIESQTNNIFDISIPYTIKSDGDENIVNIQRYEVQAKFSYQTKPKLDAAAFLVAKLLDWNQTGLLPGTSNIFFEGAYIGETFFETNVINDTVSISLGRDNNIVVERKRSKFLNDKNFVNGNKSVELEFEITIKNKKKTSIDIIVEDQIPLSSNTNTEIELGNSAKADYLNETGSLKWTTIIKSGEISKINYDYKIRYPKGTKITNLN